MLFHFHGILDWRKIRNSAIIILGLLLVIFTLDIIIGFTAIQRVYAYVVPFSLHVLISIFLKGKESWLLGGMLGTLISMVILVIYFIIS